MEKDINKEEEKLRITLNGNNPFNVPPAYFENLHGKIMDQINTLPDFNKNAQINPFAVPDGYFENLPSIVSENILTRKSKLELWLSSIQRPRIAIPIAFATLILLAGLFFYKQSSVSNMPVQQLTAEDLSNSNFIQSIDEDFFVEVLADQTSDNSDESIEQYLIDNNIDINQIENKL